MRTLRWLILLGFALTTSALAADRTSATTIGSLLALNGSPTYLGVIAAGTTVKDNSSTAVPFTIPAGGVLLLIHASAAVQILPGASAAAATATTANAIPLVAGEKILLWLKSGERWLQAITAASTSNVSIWRVD